MHPIKSEHNDTLFSMAEQQQLHSFLDEVNEETTTNSNLNNNSNPVPILLSSPFQINGNNQQSNSQNHEVYYDGYYSNKSIRTTEESSNSTTKKKKTKKPPQELLSDEQKKLNHIASEQKRRANIRIGFDKLVEIVPTLSGGNKSESLILHKSVEHLRQLLDSKQQLKERARELQLILGEVPDDDSSEDEMNYKF
ncbi:hypothetical protein K501DRAFT_334373 [Backusella circina FSU 941]|nr:hypothetical protein K501DRAFT_334373 [Backusella circina FSU 941]